MPAEAPELFGVHGQDVFATEADTAAANLRRVLEQPHDRVGNGRLTATGFAGQAKNFAGVDTEGDAVHGGGGAGVADVLHGEIFDFKNWLMRAEGCLGDGHFVTLLSGVVAAVAGTTTAADLGALILRRRGLVTSSTA